MKDTTTTIDDILDAFYNYAAENNGYSEWSKFDEFLDYDEAKQALLKWHKAIIDSNYITKEESDRRVLEGRIDEVAILRDSAKRAGDPRSTVELNTIVRAGNDRIARLRELLNGGEDG